MINSSKKTQLDKNLMLKEQASRDKGYNYIRIVDNKFEKIASFV